MSLWDILDNGAVLICGVLITSHYLTNYIVCVFVQLYVGAIVKMEVCAKDQTLAPVQRDGWDNFARSVSTHKPRLFIYSYCISPHFWQDFMDQY